MLPDPGRARCRCCPILADVARSSSSPGADVGRSSSSPGADVGRARMPTLADPRRARVPMLAGLGRAMQAKSAIYKNYASNSKAMSVPVIELFMQYVYIGGCCECGCRFRCGFITARLVFSLPSGGFDKAMPCRSPCAMPTYED
jgi:hypothetical protein